MEGKTTTPLYTQVYLKANYCGVVDETTQWRGKAEAAYEQLRTDIEDGVLEAGRELPETELVAYTGASRTPVREAVRRLAAEGLVDLLPRRAPTVSRISLRSARALFDFRRLLEPESIRLVAERADEAPVLLAAITQLLERFESMAGDEYSEELAVTFRQATGEFDSLLAQNTPNHYLGRSIQELRPHSARLRHIAHGDRSRIHEAILEHVRMCQAVLAGDSADAARAMFEHLEHVENAIFSRLLSGDAELLVS